MIPSIMIIMLSIKSNLMITNNNAVIRIDITLITIKESNVVHNIVYYSLLVSWL